MHLCKLRSVWDIKHLNKAAWVLIAPDRAMSDLNQEFDQIKCVACGKV